MVKTELNPGPTEVQDGPDITVSANALCWSKPCSSEHWKKYQTWLGNEHLRQFYWYHIKQLVNLLMIPTLALSLSFLPHC